MVSLPTLCPRVTQLVIVHPTSVDIRVAIILFLSNVLGRLLLREVCSEQGAIDVGHISDGPPVGAGGPRRREEEEAARECHTRQETSEGGGRGPRGAGGRSVNILITKHDSKFMVHWNTEYVLCQDWHNYYGNH